VREKNSFSGGSLSSAMLQASKVPVDFCSELKTGLNINNYKHLIWFVWMQQNVSLEVKKSSRIWQSVTFRFLDKLWPLTIVVGLLHND